MKAEGFESLSALFDHYRMKKLDFGRAMGWKPPITYMKMDRQRPWTVAEYEKGIKWLRNHGIRIDRNTMMRFASPRRDDGNS